MTPLVVVLVGTDHHPFHRLVEWVDQWAARQPGRARVVVQRGTSRPPRHVESVEWLEFDELQRLVAQADVVVTHGGPSTIAECRRRGLVPIVVPRDPGHGEHVDEHQLLFTARLAAEGMVLRSTTEEALVEDVERALADPACLVVPGWALSDLERTCTQFGAAVDRLFRQAPPTIRVPEPRAETDVAQQGLAQRA